MLLCSHCEKPLVADMLKLIFIVLLHGFVLYVNGDNMIGPGTWNIFRISYKQGPFDEIIIDLEQSMINRTHYVYNGKIKASVPLDDGLGMRMDVLKNVDGGFKPFMVLSDDSFMAFANKFAKDNIKDCFEAIGIDPPELPLATGEYQIKDFLFDTGPLPVECAYGHFLAEACALKEGSPIGCIEVEYEFYESEEDEDEE